MSPVQLHVLLSKNSSISAFVIPHSSVASSVPLQFETDVQARFNSCIFHRPSSDPNNIAFFHNTSYPRSIPSIASIISNPGITSFFQPKPQVAMPISWFLPITAPSELHRCSTRLRPPTKINLIASVFFQSHCILSSSSRSLRPCSQL